MGKLFRNKYHIGSIRYKGYDYSSPGMYYVTICTKDRNHYFGEIKNGEMILSGVGEIANDEWLKTPSIRQDMNITLDEFILMPDHFHAIIIIGENQYNQCYNNGQQCRYAMHRVSAKSRQKIFNKNSFGPQSKNLASIMRGFKSAVTIRARGIEPENHRRWYPRQGCSLCTQSRKASYLNNPGPTARGNSISPLPSAPKSLPRLSGALNNLIPGKS